MHAAAAVPNEVCISVSVCAVVLNLFIDYNVHKYTHFKQLKNIDLFISVSVCVLHSVCVRERKYHRQKIIEVSV